MNSNFITTGLMRTQRTNLLKKSNVRLLPHLNMKTKFAREEDIPTIPTSFDWTTTGYLTDVLDQRKRFY